MGADAAGLDAVVGLSVLGVSRNIELRGGTVETQEKQDLDSLLVHYKTAVDQWITAIRTEEDFATPDHSMKEWEVWDQAGFREEEAREKAKTARTVYVDALREKLYNF
jgi:hypothetical protein